MENKLTDLTFLRGLTGNDNVKVSKYINMFLKATPDMLNNIDKAFDEKDFESLRVTAHSLKPQLSYMGVKSLEETIKNIEFNAGHHLNLDAMPELITLLKAECSKVITELQEEFKTLNL
jgi:HPt (histidine-containing phosphotransfer) domain-containing protein